MCSIRSISWMHPDHSRWTPPSYWFSFFPADQEIASRVQLFFFRFFCCCYPFMLISQIQTMGHAALLLWAPAHTGALQVGGGGPLMLMPWVTNHQLCHVLPPRLFFSDSLIQGAIIKQGSKIPQPLEDAGTYTVYILYIFTVYIYIYILYIYIYILYHKP